MAVVTIYRLAEECQKYLNGGNVPSAANVTIPVLKIAIGQVANQLLKTDYFEVNAKMGEVIPNGSVSALYEGIAITKLGDYRSQCLLPIKPLKLPRNMGIWSVFPKYADTNEYDYTNEFIPVQIGQFNLMQSHPQFSDLLGQVGYENYGGRIVFTKNLLDINIEEVGMRLIIMDISQYGDWDVLPILPEQEWTIKQEVIKMFGGAPMPDKTVDPSVKNQLNVPINEQSES